MPAVVSKAHILDEIRRTTVKNNGKPLGRNRFAAETGIKTTDWCGFYWARWGDAIVEAGFTPNQLQTATDKDELAKQYAELAKELGHLPVHAELKMRSRDDLSFPSEATFKNRLGKKREQVEACREFCKAHSGYETVLAWCDKYLAVASLTIESDERTSDEISIGYVYLLRSGRFYKIGKSNAMGRREYEIALQLPEKLKMVHVITTDDPTGIEAYWHKRFEASRKNGEWFDLKPGDVAAFKRRRKFM